MQIVSSRRYRARLLPSCSRVAILALVLFAIATLGYGAATWWSGRAADAYDGAVWQ